MGREGGRVSRVGEGGERVSRGGEYDGGWWIIRRVERSTERKKTFSTGGDEFRCLV